MSRNAGSTPSYVIVELKKPFIPIPTIAKFLDKIRINNQQEKKTYASNKKKTSFNINIILLRYIS